MKLLLLLLFVIPMYTFGQITGSVIDKTTQEELIGAKVIASNNAKATTDIEGKFVLNVADEEYPVTLITSYMGYLDDTLVVSAAGNYVIKLGQPVQDIETIVVSAGRRSQEIEEVPISMEIIRPELIDNKGITDLEEAVNQSPGVYAMDGQVSIRGGSGFAYGAGSRVMLLWNGMPLISGEAGDTKWNSIPMEAASQIEIMKGASSVLYGSGALNGIISLSEREPSRKGEVRYKDQFGIYGDPRRESLKWWTSRPTFNQRDVYYGKMYNKFGFTVSANMYSSDGFRQGETEDRGRVSGTFYIRPEKIDRLKAGIGYNFQYQETGNFIIWESDSLGYQPSGGADASDSASTLSRYKGIRTSIDPYIKYIDKHDNLHTLKTRFYLTKNDNVFNSTQNSIGQVSYADYQFQRKSKAGYVITTGATAIYNKVIATLVGDHKSMNTAIYSQYEHEFFDRLNLTAGIRLEYFEQDGMRGDTDFYFKKDSTSKMPFYPVVRAGAHYRIAKHTHIRASYGQGIRYPSVAERYTNTNVGALNIFPNAALRPEKGWAAELGIKQGVMIGKDWKGLIDVAGFINQYSNMMEFAFGFYPPEGQVLFSGDPNSPNYIGNFIGFQAQNAEEARITGMEFSFNSTGKIKDVEITSLIGYTFMNPVTRNDNWEYLQYFSTYSDSVHTYDDPNTGEEINDTIYRKYDPMLKYRFNHLIKADIEVTWKNLSIGGSVRYNSAMVNIDRVFEEDIIPPTQVYILPGLKEYREEHDGSAMVVDARIGYKFMEHYRVGFIVNNVLNAEYSSRPGDIQAPRNFIIQLQAKF